MFFSILHILLQTSDGDDVTALVTREPDINREPLHHFRNCLTLGPNQPAMYTVVNAKLLANLLLL